MGTARSGNCLTHPSYTCFQTPPPSCKTVFPSSTGPKPPRPAELCLLKPSAVSRWLLCPRTTTATPAAPPEVMAFGVPHSLHFSQSKGPSGSAHPWQAPCENEAPGTPQHPRPGLSVPWQPQGRALKILRWETGPAQGGSRRRTRPCSSPSPSHRGGLPGPLGLRFPPLREHSAATSSQNQGSFWRRNELLIIDASIQRKKPTKDRAQASGSALAQALLRSSPPPPLRLGSPCRSRTFRSAPPRTFGELTEPKGFSCGSALLPWPGAGRDPFRAAPAPAPQRAPHWPAQQHAPCPASLALWARAGPFTSGWGSRLEPVGTGRGRAAGGGGSRPPAARVPCSSPPARPAGETPVQSAFLSAGLVTSVGRDKRRGGCACSILSKSLELSQARLFPLILSGGQAEVTSLAWHRTSLTRLVLA